ncbi:MULTISPECIES: hypothetical protein [Nocardia]|uniref:hypothetical protein n=1 Tax=Nocardia TaxID=1817 RepID=UPI002455892A|nr:MULTISPECIES: hypothetical protein [Nocardia]
MSQRTPVQAAWTTLDAVAATLDRAHFRREPVPWHELRRLAQLVRDARQVYVDALEQQHRI